MNIRALTVRSKKFLNKKNKDDKPKNNDEITIVRSGNTIEVRRVQGNKLLASIEKSRDGVPANSQWALLNAMI